MFIQARWILGHLVRPLQKLHQPSLGRQSIGLGNETRDQFIERLMQLFVPLDDLFTIHRKHLSQV